MESETKIIQWFVGLPGKIFNGKGIGTRVTFSLYLSRDYGFKGKPGSNPSEGLCRVSEEKVNWPNYSMLVSLYFRPAMNWKLPYC